ncbi:MAG: Wzz/FepE/Etk N-terminal domain-containing protein [Bacteroidales bacterium]
MEKEKQENPQNNSDEIDLIEVIRHIWDGRWLIVKVTLAFMVLGLVIAFTTTEQFKSEARLLPEVSENGGGASSLLRQFGGMGGLNLPIDDGADAIRPELYPDVLKSTPFFVHLMEQPVTLHQGSERTEVTVFNYLDEHMGGGGFLSFVKKYTIGLPGTIMKAIRGSKTEETSSPTVPGEIPHMTQAHFEASKSLRDRISASIDQRSGVISISSEFPDRRVAAQIAQYAVEYLTDYITDYRIQKAQKDLEFVKERYEEKKQEFHQAQLALARFRDANRNIVSAAAQTEEQRLQDQYNLAFNVYNGLAQQLEQARIKVQEETPVIKVLEPVSVAVERSKPKRGLVLIIAIFLGGFLGVSIVFGEIIWANFKQQIKE